MKHLILAVLLGGFLAGCTAEPKEPEQETACLPPADMAATLAQRYGESAIWIGSSGDTAVVLFIGPNSWSIVDSTRERACLMASGDAHQVIQ